MNSEVKTIAVYGSSGISQESESAQRACRLGRLLAENGFRICNGGYTGVMEACSRGAREAGGHVTGVCCDTFITRSPNPYLTEIIQTRDLLERITTLMRLSDAYIVLDGNIGTLAELFLAWNLIAIGWTRPLIVVGADMRNALKALEPYTEIEEKKMRHITFAPTAEEAVHHLRKYFNGHA